MRPARAGFSLLETILALAVLTAAVAVLGELIRLGVRSADSAVSQSQGQLLCEGKLAELASSDQLPSSTGLVAFPSDVPGGEGWLYSVAVEALAEQGLYRVEVTVARDEPAVNHPTQFTLVRWMLDPQFVASANASSDSTNPSSGLSTSSAGGASGSSSTSGSSSGGSAGGSR